MTTSVTIQNASNLLTVRLNAVELADLKLECAFDCEPAIATSSGEKYADGVVRFLCHDGMRVARRKLSIANGLRINVSEIAGTLEKSAETGVCHAIGLAIARALMKDDAALIDFIQGWTVVK